MCPRRRNLRTRSTPWDRGSWRSSCSWFAARPSSKSYRAFAWDRKRQSHPPHLPARLAHLLTLPSLFAYRTCPAKQDL